MHKLKLTIAYDGTQYVGWQVQSNGVSIQAKLEQAWQRVTGESQRITASGRTDAGVHALGQVCSVATETRLENSRLVRALNAETPYDMAVLRVDPAPADFHAIRDAVEKTYCYHVQFGPVQDPLRLRYSWFVPGPLNLEAMRQGTAWVTGKHDFASFQGANSDRRTTVRTVHRFDILEEQIHGFPGLKLVLTADGFLYNMVRNLVGSIIRVGRGREQPEWIAWVRDQTDRRCAGQTAPAQGLFLDHVVYRDDKRPGQAPSED